MLRAQQQFITQDLAQKMVFLTGPRQVGKTYLAQEIAKGFQKSVYLNYDYFEDRDIIKNAGWLLDTELLILDELHKMEGWKNYLKGVYDTTPRNQKIIVTGSDRRRGRFCHWCGAAENWIQPGVRDRPADPKADQSGRHDPD